MLPGKTVTQYILQNFEQNKDIKIELKIKSGDPKLFLYYTYEENSYVNYTVLDKMTRASQVIRATRESNQKYKIQVEANDNQCIYIPSKAGRDCHMYAVINCETEKDCLYELFFDHVGNQIQMKPKVMYSNVITEGEIDKYEIHITDY